jgi:hypothetical protein
MKVKIKRTDEKLWKKIVNKYKSGTKGGKANQWSAIKANLATTKYKNEMLKRGKKPYIGKNKTGNSLIRWNKQKWKTKSGKPSLKTGERFLPSKAIQSLSKSEYESTTRKKRNDLKKGIQFSKNPRKIALKIKKYTK